MKKFYTQSTLTNDRINATISIIAEWALIPHPHDPLHFDLQLLGFFPETPEDEKVFLSDPMTKRQKQACLKALENDMSDRLEALDVTYDNIDDIFKIGDSIH